VESNLLQQLGLLTGYRQRLAHLGDENLADGKRHYMEAKCR
jgi:hypothetical protein